MTTTQKVSEDEIKSAYQGEAFANGYIEKRFVIPAQALLHQMQVQAVLSHIQKQGPNTILEVAPGPGRITRDVTTSAKRVCLEYNEGMIKVGKEASDPKIHWIQGDAFNMPTDRHFETPFDLAYTFRFIRHFKSDDRNRIYEQFKKNIKPGGYLIFDAVNAKVSKPLRDASPNEYPIYDVLYDDIDQLKSELEAAGFKVEKVIPVQRGFPLMMKLQGFLGSHLKWLHKFLVKILQNATTMAPLEWIIVCRRV